MFFSFFIIFDVATQASNSLDEGSFFNQYLIILYECVDDTTLFCYQVSLLHVYML